MKKTLTFFIVFVTFQLGFSQSSDRDLNIITKMSADISDYSNPKFYYHGNKNISNQKIKQIGLKYAFEVIKITDIRKYFKNNRNLKYAAFPFKNFKGVVDRNMNLVIPCIYEDITVIKNEYFIVKQNEKFGLLNNENQEVISLNQENIEFAANIFIIKNGDSFQLLNNSLKELDEKYALVKVLNKNAIEAYTIKDEMYTILTSDGQKITIADIIYLDDFKNLYYENREGKFGFIANEKKLILDCEFDLITVPEERNTLFSEDLVIFKKNNLYGYYNGKSMVSPKYKKIEYFEDSDFSNCLVLTNKSSKKGVIDIKEERTIVPFEYYDIFSKTESSGGSISSYRKIGDFFYCIKNKDDMNKIQKYTVKGSYKGKYVLDDLDLRFTLNRNRFELD